LKARNIDHICIAVHDLGKARKVYEETLGLELALEYVAESEKIHVARYYLGEVALELMEPTDQESEVAKFLKRRGEGVFLFSYGVDDVEKGLAELKAKGEKTIDDAPRRFMGNRYAFIQPPNRMCGVLTEIFDGGADHPSK
jgi:methylmalonyl-CoA/ethylmalonyl-CoA epimerase